MCDGLSGPKLLDRLEPGLAGPDSNAALQRHDEDLAVADLALTAPGTREDRFDRSVDRVVVARDLDPYAAFEAGSHGLAAK